MAFVGQAGEFVHVKEDIARYIEQVQLYLQPVMSKTITRFLLFWPWSEQILMELSAIYWHLNNRKISFDELKKELIAHYSPKLILMAVRFKFHRRNQLDRSVCGLARATFVEVWIWFVFGGSVAWPTCLWGKKRAHSKVAVGREKFDICKSIWNVKSIELANKEYFHEVRIPPEDSINEVNRASKWRLRCLFSLW